MSVVLSPTQPMGVNTGVVGNNACQAVTFRPVQTSDKS